MLSSNHNDFWRFLFYFSIQFIFEGSFLELKKVNFWGENYKYFLKYRIFAKQNP